jgi:RNA polymerase sigma-70 factor, ECF subfamily
MPPVTDLAGSMFERHGRSVRQYLRALTGSAELAADLSQEVFLRVVRGADRYEPRERERAWLFRIARNALTDHRRRAAVRPIGSGGSIELAVPPAQGLATELGRAMAGLPDAEREAFLMAELGGLTYVEIAAALELSLPAVRSAIYRARLSLRAALMPPPPIAPAALRGQDHDD